MAHSIVHTEIVVKATRTETPGYRSVVLERPRNFAYQAGDWMDMRFEHTHYPGGTTYSFASSPTEPDLFITFRDGVSPYKTALMSVQPGDRLVMTQYGNAYDFHLRDNRASVLIAGGVGIAPFRSMLKELYDAGGHNSVQLLYLNQSEEFIFKKELDEWQSALPNIQISYIVTRSLGRNEQMRLIGGVLGEPKQAYYIAGPPPMVASTAAHLTDQGIDKRMIRLDSFDGY